MGSPLCCSGPGRRCCGSEDVVRRHAWGAHSVPAGLVLIGTVASQPTLGQGCSFQNTLVCYRFCLPYWGASEGAPGMGRHSHSGMFPDLTDVLLSHLWSPVSCGCLAALAPPLHWPGQCCPLAGATCGWGTVPPVAAESQSLSEQLPLLVGYLQCLRGAPSTAWEGCPLCPRELAWRTPLLSSEAGASTADSRVA